MPSLPARGALLAITAALALASTSGARACEFAVVKEQIDIVLDRDAARGATFRKEFKEGADSIAAMEALVSADMRKQIDICRYYVSEYLTKRGFPPVH
jgi:2,3-bisphosphoglycerate-independent phosphoglycerate mutase